MTKPMRKSMMVQVEGVKRVRRRPKLTWLEVVRKDMGACDNMAVDSVE